MDYYYSFNKNKMLNKILLVLLLPLTFVVDSTFTAELGDSCITPFGKSGFCSYFSKCDKLFKIVLSPPISMRNKQILAASQCGWLQDQPLVCCDELDRVLVPLFDTRTGVLPSDEECGIQNMDRVVGGTSTGIGEFPWMALLKYANGLNTVAFHCSATLITRQHVLSAAHCIYGRDIYGVWNPIEVRLGEWDMNTSIDCIGDSRDYDCADPHIDVPIEQIIPHENYVANSKSHYHDIVLIRMQKRVPMTEFIRPICLPKSAHLRNLITTNQRYIVAGWGKTESSTRSTRLKKVYLRGVDTGTCAHRYKLNKIFISPSQLCAGGIDGRDTCKGDSGSGLVAVDDSNLSSVHWYLAGIVSFGLTPCGSDGWPGVYTRITDYIDWIEAHIQ